MATLAHTPLPADLRERMFFASMAIIIATTVLLAFGLFHLAGLSSFGAPWWVHVHAVTFVGWIALYVTQNIFVLSNRMQQHRKLGRFMAIWAMWMLFVGLVLTPTTLSAGRAPPFFTPAFFLALDWVNILVFAGLFLAAIRLRHRTDWHRRLMLVATVSVIAPALGRLIVLSGQQMTAWFNITTLLPYIAAGMVFDLVARKRIHPAYLIGAATLLLMGVVIEILATFPPFIALAGRISG